MEMRTWDGLPVSVEKPHGVAVITWRSGQAGREWLILHRAHNGPEYEGDWAWTPPSGARFPGETAEACATRELVEETGLRLQPAPTELGTEDWAVYIAEAPPDAEVVVDAEHDRFLWLPAKAAAQKCRPLLVAASIEEVARYVDRAHGG